MIEFAPWPKVARLNRDITITEKIDGCNGAVGVVAADAELVTAERKATFAWPEPGQMFLVYAQSRNRIITPDSDNHGFAKWVWDNADLLAGVLGVGVHFGEWWGSGIQRGYGLPKGEKRFSLFNTKRWDHLAGPNRMFDSKLDAATPPALDVVPVLYQGPLDPYKDDWSNPAALWGPPPWSFTLDALRRFGSIAAPGFENPEGVVVYHQAADFMFKVTLTKDEAPKSVTAKGKPKMQGHSVGAVFYDELADFDCGEAAA
jgi:RNA ligase